jgi:hypothetical protein
MVGGCVDPIEFLFPLPVKGIVVVNWVTYVHKGFIDEDEAYSVPHDKGFLFKDVSKFIGCYRGESLVSFTKFHCFALLTRLVSPRVF